MNIPDFTQRLEPRRLTRCAELIPSDDPLPTLLAWLETKGRQLNPRFRLDKDCVPAYALALSWLLGLKHPDIDDPMKGLCVSGSAGSGKTTLVKLLRLFASGLGVERPFWDEASQRYQYQPLLWNADLHAISIAQHYATEGELIGLGYRVLHIGDLGSEPEETRHWGTRTNPLSDLICQRSDRSYYDAPMVLTTNLTPDDLRQRYGDRAASRLSGGCIPLRMVGPDRRSF